MTTTFITPDLCDAHGDSVQVLEPILKNFGGKRAFGGEMVTVQCCEDNGLVKQLLASNGDGKVLVVDGGGSTRCALMGDMMADTAVANGWQGLIIFGCIRDVDDLARIGLGVQALASTPRPPQRLGAGATQLPVSFGGVTFQPGHYVYADNNGVIVSASPLL